MSLEAMVVAARDGKVTDFEAAFNSEISQRVAQRIQDVKAEIGAPRLGDDSEED